MKKFDYDDTVQVVCTASPELRPGAKASIVGVFENRPGKWFDKFPKGIVYSIEFEDGDCIEIHESQIQSFRE